MLNQLIPVQDYLYHETESQSNQSVNNNTNNAIPPDKAQTKNKKDHKHVQVALDSARFIKKIISYVLILVALDCIILSLIACAYGAEVPMFPASLFLSFYLFSRGGLFRSSRS